jgi:hypothetical protein
LGDEAGIELTDVDREPSEVPSPERQNGVVRIIRSGPVLAVHDLELSGAWYRDVLGCELDDVAGLTIEMATFRVLPRRPRRRAPATALRP